jgi:hypothetical protein
MFVDNYLLLFAKRLAVTAGCTRKREELREKQEGGFIMYIDPDSRVEDNRSTAWSFTLVSIIGIVLLVLLDMDVLPVTVADFQKIILSVVMGILFLIFLGIGIFSFLSIKKLKASAERENSLDREILEWFLKEYTGFMKNYSVEEEDGPEELYYPRYQKMSELILAQYPGISEEFKDHIIEELYSSLFPD